MKKLFGFGTAMALVMAVMGCGSSSEEPTRGGEEMPSYGDSIYPEKIQSGFDGTNVYKVPVSFFGAGDVVWASSDPSVATIEKATRSGTDDLLKEGQWAMITSKKPGKVTITATSGTATARAELTVNGYTAAQNTAGKTRYTTAGTGFAGSMCATCHGGPTGVEHSPSTIAGYDDPALVSAITTAAYPDGVRFVPSSSMRSAPMTSFFDR